MNSLRESLGVMPDPDFDMKLPPGWSRREVDDQTFDTMVSGLKRRLMQEHRPELYAETRRMLKRSFDDMRQNGAFAFFVATDQDPSTLWMPASMVASIRRPEPGSSLDDLARNLIVNYGATPLMGDVRTLRYEQEKHIKLGADSIVSRTVTYLIPVPGTKRRRALQIVAGLSTPLEMSGEDPYVVSTKFLFDSCVSTVTWQPPVQ
ncbi:hypothetical protein J2S40_004364 [Nocardioides luteus]|uniref:Uncharacterized protein n=1 Tax=Nocardioides luteus TaxID=1844 RepID=A0ABQ5SRH0_9ACTN|nr:protein TPRXL [Nocardioides luteus]MDR7313306.1 hypothetical protein [Nocardioides luteus]GGR60128.1 hypothetical protein GCM10010197_28690 [Nocardioides luteus]GLJ66371.1 hypothetical protein GCM10017579_04070 [Nocardioides luteus]